MRGKARVAMGLYMKTEGGAVPEEGRGKWIMADYVPEVAGEGSGPNYVQSHTEVT